MLLLLLLLAISQPKCRNRYLDGCCYSTIESQPQTRPTKPSTGLLSGSDPSNFDLPSRGSRIKAGVVQNGTLANDPKGKTEDKKSARSPNTQDTKSTKHQDATEVPKSLPLPGTQEGPPKHISREIMGHDMCKHAFTNADPLPKTMRGWGYQHTNGALQ